MCFFTHPYSNTFQKQIQMPRRRAGSDWDIAALDSEGGVETTTNCYVFLFFMLFFLVFTSLSNKALKTPVIKNTLSHHYDG